MKTSYRGRQPARTPAAAFWDTSGIVPLCCYQAQTAKARQTLRLHAQQVVWWATPVEAVSSLNLLIREGHLTAAEGKQGLRRLDVLRKAWNEIQPTEEVREWAERLLGVHKLRAADALQLAAALVWSSNRLVAGPLLQATQPCPMLRRPKGFLYLG